MRLLSVGLTGKDEHGPSARVGRSKRVVRIMVEVPLMCRGVIVVKRKAILIDLKIHREVVTSVELVPFRNVTVKKKNSTTIN